MVKKAISIIGSIELLVLLSYFYSFDIFINMQIAYLSSLFVILGSSFAYKKMVSSRVESDTINETRDLLDTIEDPHELYDDVEINDAPAEELDLKAIVKEERAKIKTFSASSMKHGVRGSISLFRIIPYVLLALGFIGLSNNNLLDLKVYLPSLLIGIIVGSISSKELM
jgi:hypothetical protein